MQGAGALELGSGLPVGSTVAVMPSTLPTLNWYSPGFTKPLWTTSAKVGRPRHSSTLSPLEVCMNSLRCRGLPPLDVPPPEPAEDRDLLGSDLQQQQQQSMATFE